MVTSAAAARAISSRASSPDAPVASDWAETAWMPVLSSSVNDARKTSSAEPKYSTSLRAFVGPRPGVSEIASHSKRWVAAGDTAALDKRHSEPTVISDREQSQGHASQWVC